MINIIIGAVIGATIITVINFKYVNKKIKSTPVNDELIDLKMWNLK